MIRAKQLLREIVVSLRETIAPAIVEPYAKSQAYMAAVVLEFVARQVDERGDLEEQMAAVMLELARDLSRIPALNRFVRGNKLDERGLCELIENLYAERASLGEENFVAANRRVRAALRGLLNEELKVSKDEGEK